MSPAPDAAAAGGSVASAIGALAGTKPSRPGTLQEALLAKPQLTYADYETAMQAMAGCVEQRAPGTTVTLKPSDYDPRLFDSMFAYGGVEGSMSVSDGAQEPGTSQHEHGQPSTAPSVADSGPGSPGAGGAKPASVVAREKTIAQCQLEYSAYVEDKWRAQQVLTTAEETVQKPQFLKCLTDAGVTLPSDTSDSSLSKWLGSPEWFKGLTDQESKQADKCMTEYIDLINTFAQ